MSLSLVSCNLWSICSPVFFIKIPCQENGLSVAWLQLFQVGVFCSSTCKRRPDPHSISTIFFPSIWSFLHVIFSLLIRANSPAPLVCFRNWLKPVFSISASEEGDVRQEIWFLAKGNTWRECCFHSEGNPIGTRCLKSLWASSCCQCDVV